MKKQLIKHEGGYSLIEVMAAVTVLGVGVLAVAMLQLASIQANAHAMRVSEANSLIEDRIEAFKHMPYDKIKNDDSGNPVVETKLGKNGMFTRKTTVTDDQPVTGSKTILVEVAWKTSRDHAISYQTIISR